MEIIYTFAGVSPLVGLELMLLSCFINRPERQDKRFLQPKQRRDQTMKKRALFVENQGNDET